MRTEVIRITPQIAQGFLETNHNNRNISERLVKKYSQDMLNNQWTTTHQGIAFYEDGTLADGQHRLFGIVRSGCTVTMHVTYGLKREQAINIDAKFFIADNEQVLFLISKATAPDEELAVWLNTPFFTSALSFMFNEAMKD